MRKIRLKAKDSGRRARILVVEDDQHLISALESALAGSHLVTIASDCPTAIDLLERERFDLVLLDLILPRGTGLDLLEHLARGGAEAPPIIVTSAIGRQVDLDRYAGLVMGRLTKPFGLEEIQRAVREGLQGGAALTATPQEPKGSVLLVDDDPQLLESLTATLTGAGYRVLTAPNGSAALQIVSRERLDAVVTDWIMPGISGIDLLREIKERLPEVPVLLMTGYGTPSLMQTAIAARVADLLTKPFPPQALLMALAKSLRSQPNSPAPPVAPAPVPRVEGAKGRAIRYGTESIHGESLAMDRARQALARAAATDSNVLLLGESGTGKELFAQSLHQLSSRRNGPFVAVNAAAVPESLLESELFGYESGAFTGARREGRPGKFQQANGGTIFLDEIGDLPLSLQTKLLRVLQEGEIDVVGGATRRIDVRVVAATHQDLQAMVRRGAFRSDLFYRLHVLTIHLPPLRERREDIPGLAQLFLAQLCDRYGRPGVRFSDEVVEILAAYHWPGNVRELRNAVERAFVFAQGTSILPVHLPPELLPARTGGLHEPAARYEVAAGGANGEREAILQALRACGGNKVQAAKLLGISRAGLYVKLKVHGIQ